jgi:hypothetical protein
MTSIIEPIEAMAPTARVMEVLELSDLELVRRLYATISESGTGSGSDRLADELYLLVGEVVERWAPHVELADRIATVREDELTNPEDEIEDSLSRMAGKFALRVQLQAKRQSRDA